MSPMSSNNEIAPCLAVVMPAYNEAPTIGSIVKMVLAQRPVQELIVIDDCSTDNTCSARYGASSSALCGSLVDNRASWP